MKKLILILLLSPIVAFAQFFEGKVVYANTYKSKMPNLTDQQLSAMMGSTANWYIKGGDYKSETNGTLVLWQTFVNKDNKIYTKIASSEALLYNDAALSDNEVIKAEVHKNVTEVLGYQCDELVLTTKTGLQKYYFSSKLPIDSKLFVNHKYGEWYAYLSKANAVQLKMIVETPQLILESVATAVTPMKLSAALFQLPANSTTVKAP
jgi:hypothetical protein